MLCMILNMGQGMVSKHNLTGKFHVVFVAFVLKDDGISKWEDFAKNAIALHKGAHHCES